MVSSFFSSSYSDLHLEPSLCLFLFFLPMFTFEAVRQPFELPFRPPGASRSDQPRSCSALPKSSSAAPPRTCTSPVPPPPLHKLAQLILVLVPSSNRNLPPPFPPELLRFASEPPSSPLSSFQAPLPPALRRPELQPQRRCPSTDRAP